MSERHPFDPALITGFERYLRVLSGLTETSVLVYTRTLRAFVSWWAARPAASPTMPTTITRHDIEDYLEYCFYAGNANVTRLTKLVALRKYFRYLTYEHVIDEDPTALIPTPRLKKGFVPKFTQDEIIRLFSVLQLQTEKGFRDFAIIMIAAFTGARIQEIIDLTLQDISDEGASVDLHFVGKFSKERQVYLWKIPSEVARVWMAIRLTQGARARDPLFVSYSSRAVHETRRPLTQTAIDAMLKKTAALAQIRKPRISMHMFRATHASDLRHIRGYDTPAIAERLGHENIATTDRYIPTRGRIHREYPSLAVYWKDFTKLWKERRDQSLARNYYDHRWNGDA